MKRILLALICAVCMTGMEAKTIVAYFSATGTTKAAAELAEGIIDEQTVIVTR